LSKHARKRSSDTQHTHTLKQQQRREFLAANYVEMKKGNPELPILVRECAGAEAKLIARYGEGEAAFGREGGVER
jgi:hypothetical protein